jgi:fructose-bisphosphate aldolase class II
MGRLQNNKANAILDAAVKGKYAIPAVCVVSCSLTHRAPSPTNVLKANAMSNLPPQQYNLEGALATLRAAEAKRSPAMLLLFPWCLSYTPHLAHLCASMARSAHVPLTVHMDHAQTPALVREAADLGAFDSIMVDMSHYSKDENLKLTRELTTYCHERGIATEAEPGRIEGGEDGVAQTADLEGVLTTAEEARRFVDTGIDWLAPAFGNVHGEYGPRGVRLEYERLEGINEAVGGERGVRLVAHGTDPFTPEIYERLIGVGISKVNINKVVNRRYMELQKEGRLGLTALMEEGTRRMQEVVEESMDMFGSTGKA